MLNNPSSAEKVIVPDLMFPKTFKYVIFMGSSLAWPLQLWPKTILGMVHTRAVPPRIEAFQYRGTAHRRPVGTGIFTGMDRAGGG